MDSIDENCAVSEKRIVKWKDSQFGYPFILQKRSVRKCETKIINRIEVR